MCCVDCDLVKSARIKRKKKEHIFFEEKTLNEIFSEVMGGEFKVKKSQDG